MERGEQPEEFVIEHPNRDKAASKLTKAVVVLLVLASVGLMLVVTLGGWDELVGARPVQVAYIVIYLLLAFFIARWNRGALPLISALAIVLMIFAAVSTPAWFDRDKAGYAATPVPADVVGLVCIVLAVVQLFLILFAMRGFSQAWNVEVERPLNEPRAAGELRTA